MTRLRRVAGALLVGLVAACGPQPTPSLVDLAEVRGFGDPVVLYEVDRAQAVSDLVRAEIGRIGAVSTIEDAEVVAGDRPYLRCAFFGDVTSGRYKWARALVAFGPGGEYAQVFFRSIDDSTWSSGRIDGPTAATLAENAERLGGSPILLSVRASAPALVAVRRAITEITVQEGLFAEDMKVENIEAADFPDSSLGCAEEGEVYAQVLTPGFKISLRGPTSVYDVRVAQEIVKICRSEPAEAPAGVAP